MIAAPAMPAGMRCEVAEFNSRGLPTRLRWTASGTQTPNPGARERGIVLSTAIQTTEESIPLAMWKEHLARRYTGSTPYLYHWHMRKFAAWSQARGERLADVTQTSIETFLAEMRDRGHKPNMVKMYYKSLKNFFLWAEEEHGAVNPMRKIRAPKTPTGVHLKDEFTDEEVLAILATCNSTPMGIRDRAMICLMAYCGLRQMAVHHADVSDLETKDGRMVLWIMAKGGGGKDRFAVLPAPAENALRDWLAVRPGPVAGALFIGLDLGHTKMQRRLALSRIRIMFLGRKRKIGINNPRKTAHSLRHSAITNAIRHGATPLQAMAMAGHNDIRNTMIYYHESDRLTRPAEDLIVFTTPGAEEKTTDEKRITPAV
jgi:site-specific recombinase XerD